MKRIVYVATLFVMFLSASAAFAAIGDVYDPVADFSWTDPSPWQYLCQEGSGVWDGTYNFTPMEVRTLITTGSPMWGAPNSADFYGWQCGIYLYYGNLAVNSYKMLTDPTRTYGVGILGFVAPDGGDWRFQGKVSGYTAGNDGWAWINSPLWGEVWRGRVTGDWQQSLPTFDVTVNLAAGDAVYFGCEIISGHSVYGLWETYPLYWQFTATQVSDVVIPEPGSLVALAGGLAGMIGFVLRKR